MEISQFDPSFEHLRDKKVKAIFNGMVVYGILSYAGFNRLLHNEYQVTLDRTPYWPVDPKTIKPYELSNN